MLNATKKHIDAKKLVLLIIFLQKRMKTRSSQWLSRAYWA